MILKLTNQILKHFNLSVNKLSSKIDISQDIRSEESFMKIYEKVKDYTMTSPERIFSLYKAIKYVIQNEIPGDFVECGVWRGGSAMTIALTLIELGITDRKIYMYDTFEGMNEPTNIDKDYTGNTAAKLLAASEKINNKTNVWCYSAMDAVQHVLYSTGYNKNNLLFIKGRVEETIPETLPLHISLLRLDTDWYESTKHEMVHLFPILENDGVLIIDDYGHWQGSRLAVDEYLIKNNISLLLNRIDYTGRIAIK